MRLLAGRFPCQLDDAKRLAIPARLREQLGQAEGGTWFLSLHELPGALSLWDEEEFGRLSQQLDTGLLDDEALQEFQSYLFSRSERVRMDKQGRLLIPEVLFRDAGLTPELTVVGNNNRLEIWARAAWDEREQQQLARRAELRKQARQVISSASGQALGRPAGTAVTLSSTLGG